MDGSVRTTPERVPPVETLKSQARRLRDSLQAAGTPVSHAQALELLARQYGCRDWNVLHAAAGNRPPPAPVQLGDRVRGRYLSQAFAGEIIGVRELAEGRYRITVQFDEPVDVVTWDSFSAFRRRVSCTIDRRGRTAERTSDGRPHMELAL
ncbi:glyoxalase superfamily protein [Marinibaculum pumilum]|uniref:Glyoxalase superfamily protein n=1 Tax=Marinibaculum pumilum TaxID=1766165 RepID=A0ABV7KX83_9PROT